MGQSIVKRVSLYTVGLLIMTFGIALSSKAGIGVAPVSTISYAASYLLPLSFGMCSSMFHGICFIAQLLLTRRFNIMVALQIPAVYVFGFLIDFFSLFLRFSPPALLFAIPLIIFSVLVFSFGLRIILGSDLVLPPPDSLVRLIGDLLGWPMSKAKLVFDIAVVASSAVLTLLFLKDAFVAVGIGTIICVAITGPAIGFYQKAFPFLDISH